MTENENTNPNRAVKLPKEWAAFEEFHSSNPNVYETIVDLARKKVEVTGTRLLGAQQLLEVCRWDIAMQTGDGEFKINNNYGAFYARLIMDQEPDLKDMFALRSSSADLWMDWRNGRFPQLPQAA